MKKLLLTAFFTIWTTNLMAVSDQAQYIYRQRAIMLSQHQYEKNLDLIQLDPETCKVPVKKQDRIRVLKLNTKQFEEEGKLTHCKGIKFIGKRKIIRDLVEQRKSVIQIQEFENTKGKSSDGITIQEPIDNTTPTGKDDFSLIGSSPFPLPIIAGYSGIPYFSNFHDETYNSNLPKHLSRVFHYYARGLPDGITISHSMIGGLVGVPKKSGSFSPIIELVEYKNAVPVVVFRGPVPIKIFDTPKHTVLNSGHRGLHNAHLKFINKPFPLLTTEFFENNEHYPESLRSLNSVRSGKHYFEVKVEDYSGVFDIKFSGLDSKSIGGFLNGPKAGQQYKWWPTISQSEFKKIKSGDVVGVAIDGAAGKIWYRVNGHWLGQTKHNFSIRYPGGDLEPQVTFAKNQSLWPEIYGSKIRITTNFGDQPFYHELPKDFSGIPFDKTEIIFPNLWDINTASHHIGIDVDIFQVDAEAYAKRPMAMFNHELLGLMAASGQRYVLDGRGDAILAMEPKSSGRWQFELQHIGFGQKGQIGIAPSDFPTRSLTKLGASGTGSIGLRRLDEFVSETGKGVLYVDGVPTEITYFEDKTRFTFDCNFDSGLVNIYADGKFLIETKLPKGHSSWRIAMISEGSAAILYTLPEDMKYPVKGVKPWTLEVASCSANCSGYSIPSTVTTPVSEEDEIQTCEAINLDISGKTAAKNEYTCELRETRIGGVASCVTPKSPHPCMDLGNSKFYCSPTDTMVTYNDRASCESTCFGIKEFSRKCTNDGWK